MLKKILVGIICCLLIGGTAVVAAVGYKSSQSYDKIIVYLGDSICEGILGSSPFSERDSNCYYAIVGRRNNFRYVDKSVSGDTTTDLYNRLTRTDTPSLERQYWVSKADIVHISILGNDFLGGNVGETAIKVLLNDYTDLNKVRNKASQYFALSIERIKELNPDVLILVNTVYNPLDAAATLLSPEQKETFLEQANGDQTKFRKVGGQLLQFLNGIIYDYLEQNPGAFEIIDVYTAFDNLYKEDYSKGIALLYKDWLHPSNEGHALIANLIQSKIEELNLVSKQRAVTAYKAMRIEQIERLFSDTEVNIASAKANILSAETCQQISERYFDAIRGFTPQYTNKPITRRLGKVFRDTKTFEISSIKMGEDNFSSFINKEKSQVIYRDDGTFSLLLVPDGSTIGLANIALNIILREKTVNISEILSAPAGFGTSLETYIKEVFPGFDSKDFKKIVELLTSLGIYINGLDYESETMVKFMDSLREKGEIPLGFKLPSGLSIEVKGYYFVEKAGDFTNIHMCVGNVSNNGYPFLYATLHTEDDGNEWIETSIEVSKITLYADKKQ